MEKYLPDAPWGAYAAPREARCLRRLIALRLGRGWLRKAILRRWIGRFGPWVDMERAGIGYRLNVQDNNTDGKILATPGGPDRPEIAALAEHCRGGLFIDIGANTGYYALSLVRAGATRVIAIEPYPAARARLRFHIALNGRRQIITILPTAVGPKGADWLFPGHGDLGCASLHRQSDPGPSVAVPVRPLLWILRALRVERVDALKIDVEGFEDRVLIPYLDKAPRSLWPACIAIEHRHRELWRRDVLAHLLRCGYRLRKKTRDNAIYLSTNAPA